jgi:deltex-like protein
MVSFSFPDHQGIAVEGCLTYIAPSSLDPNTGSGTPLGKSVSGCMTVTTLTKTFPNTRRTKTIKIEYDIPSGNQQPYHEHPGKRYDATNRTAYLPNNADGRKLIARLKHAWVHGLIFTVGTSQTTGKSDSVTWSSIPHKTSLHGGTYGWPDSNYIKNCNRALDKLLVPTNPKDCTMTSPAQLSRRSTSPAQLPCRTSTQSHAVCVEKIIYTSPESLATSNAVLAALRPPSSTATTGDCSICLEPLSQQRVVHIQGCDHAYHFKCINDYMKHNVICPTCRAPIGAPQGKSPSGSMSITLNNRDCPGYPNTNTIEITYEIPSGTQRSYQENPDSPFRGTTRTAYLPNNDEGRRLLTRLKYSFLHGLTFRVGTSLTSGAHNVVTWTSIHHKTSLYGGSHSFPDPDYMSNCNSSLDALSVPDADACLLTATSKAP